MNIGWLLHRDWILVDRALADELHGLLAAHRPPAGSALVLVARSVRLAPEFVLRVTGHPVVVITECYDGNGGALDTSGSSGRAGATGLAGSPLSLYALAASNVSLIARGGDGNARGAGGAGGPITFRALPPTGIRAMPELCGRGGSGRVAGRTTAPSLSWYTGSAQWRSDMDAILGSRTAASAA